MKKIIALVACLSRVASLAVGGSIAYLQSTDSTVNVMTLGNVDIKIREYERGIDANGDYETITTSRGNGYKLVPYTNDDAHLMPAVGTITGYDSTRVFFEQFGEGHELGAMDVFKPDFKNVQDKFVFIENAGKSDAYIRTYIAYEIGSMENALTDGYIMLNANVSWKRNDIGTMKIDNNNYYVVEYVYDGNFYPEGGTVKPNENGRHPDGIVHPGEWTYNNLAQIYLASKVENEHIEKIDGNKNGKLDILVLAQGVQAAGFEDAETALDTAFPKGTTDAEIAATVAEWFGDVTPVHSAATADELKAALAEGGTVVLTADVELDADETITVAAGKEVTLDLGGHKIIGGEAEGSGNREMFNVKGKMNVKNGTIEMTVANNQSWNAMSTIFDVNGGGVLNIENATLDNKGGTDMNFAVHLNNWGEVTLNVTNSTLNATYIPVRVFNSGNDMNNGTIKNSKLNGKYCFWVHNYTLADFGTQEKVDAHAKLLNFDIYGNGNTFTNTGKAPVLYGFTDTMYFDANGNPVQ